MTYISKPKLHHPSLTQNKVCHTRRDYEGRISTAGNLAFPFSPSDCKVGEVFEFNVYHLMRVDDPAELFPVNYIQFTKGC